MKTSAASGEPADPGRRACLGLLAAPVFTAVRAADEAAWPNRPLRFVVAFAAGGTMDSLARWLAPRLAERLGVQVLVDNRPGAGGNIALEHVARAAPDGATWLLTSSVVATNPVFQRLPVEPQKDLVPVMLLTRSEMMLFARHDLPAANAAELLALLRDRPKGLTCGASGGGTRLGCELLRQQSGAAVVVVEYKGSAPAMNDLAAGHIDLSVDIAMAGRSLIAAGRIKAVARTGAQRQGVAAELLPGFDIEGWQALFAPVGVPAATVARMNLEINRILADRAARERLLELGLDPVGGAPEALARTLRDDTDRYRRIGRAAGLQAD